MATAARAPAAPSTLEIPTPAVGQSASSTQTVTSPRPAQGRMFSLLFATLFFTWTCSEKCFTAFETTVAVAELDYVNLHHSKDQDFKTLILFPE